MSLFEIETVVDSVDVQGSMDGYQELFGIQGFLKGEWAWKVAVAVNDFRLLIDL